MVSNSILQKTNVNHIYIHTYFLFEIARPG